MKTPKYILLTLALGICSAGAIGLTIHHDTQQKLDFTFDWYPNERTGPSIYQGLSYVQFDWTTHIYNTPGFPDDAEVDFLIYSPLFHEEGVEPPIHRAGLGLLYLPYPDNFIGFFEFPGADGKAKVKLGADLMSVRFTFHEKDYLFPAPDTGGTLGLMMFACAGLLLLKRAHQFVFGGK